MIQHTWDKIEVTNDADWSEVAICTVCGAERNKARYTGIFLYSRNQIVFGGRPECYSDKPDFQEAMGHFNL